MSDITSGGVQNLNTPEGGSADAMFIREWSGEVITSFEQSTVMRPYVMSRSIRGAKSKQFPALGRSGTKYHATPGENILTSAGGGSPFVQDDLVTEYEIFVDRPLLSTHFFDEWEEMINHYDARSPFTTEQGRALAVSYDLLAIRAGIIGAQSGIADIHDSAGAALTAPLTDADFLTNGASAAQTLFEIARRFDQADIPSEGRHLICQPQTYYNLLQQTDLISRDFNPENGSLKSGNIIMVAGIQIHSTPRMTDVQGLGTPGVQAAHRNDQYGAAFDFANSVGLVFHESAIGGLMLQDMRVIVKNFEEHLGTMVRSGMSYGLRWLRPEALQEIQIA